MSRYPKWTAIEQQRLRKLYPTIPAYELANRLGRPEAGIRVMASRLGIKASRTLHWTGSWRFLEGNPYLQLSNTTRSYLAGLIDGEGWIVRDKRGFWRIGIANTERVLIEWLRDTIEYSTVNLKRSRNQKWKHAWQWFLHGNIKVEALLELLLPYLLIKRESAKTALLDIRTHNGDV